MTYEGSDEQPPDDPVGSVADERGGLEEDLRVQRSEEELRASVSEAGQVNVKKCVRTEREVVRVPKGREEVDIERVPVVGEASGATEADISEDEVVVQVFEEEVVVTKRVVLKEEIRIRKRVVELDNQRMYRSQRCPARLPISGAPGAGGELGRWAAWATSS